jgi:hypothetical protein
MTADLFKSKMAGRLNRKERQERKGFSFYKEG